MQNEENWIGLQRKNIEDYLANERVDHLGVGEYPAFHVHPYLSLWAVQSKRSPGSVGWWAISGDLPTDYISGKDARDPRKALRVFAQRWQEASEFMLCGKKHPQYSIGSSEQWPELGDLLQRRAEILKRYAEDDAIWREMNI